MFARCTPSFMLALVIVVGCRPDDADAGPRIAIDACATNETEDCELDFGARDISVRVQQSVVVSNPSLTSPLTILNVDLSGDPAFRIVEQPSLILPRSSEAIIIDVRPNVEAVLETEMLIQTDATNTRLSPEGASAV